MAHTNENYSIWEENIVGFCLFIEFFLVHYLSTSLLTRRYTFFSLILKISFLLEVSNINIGPIVDTVCCHPRITHNRTWYMPSLLFEWIYYSFSLSSLVIFNCKLCRLDKSDSYSFMCLADGTWKLSVLLVLGFWLPLPAAAQMAVKPSLRSRGLSSLPRQLEKRWREEYHANRSETWVQLCKPVTNS